MKTNKNSRINNPVRDSAQIERAVPASIQWSKPARLSYERWFEQYRPIKNHLDSNASFDGCMFETYGEELKFVCAQPPRSIWTLVDCDGKLRIIEGPHFVDRIGYFITEVSYHSNRNYSIKAD